MKAKLLKNKKGKNKIAVMVGASEGIGFAAAEALTKKGYDLVLFSRRPEALKEAKKKILKLNPKISVTTVPGDAANKEDAKKLADAIKKLGKVDLLLNSAGTFRWGDDKDTEEFLRRANYETKKVITRAFLPIFKKQKSGHIILIASQVARPDFPKKWQKGEMGYVKSMRKVRVYGLRLKNRLKKFNVKVDVLFPPSIDTPMLRREFTKERGFGSDYWAKNVVSAKDFAREALRPLSN